MENQGHITESRDHITQNQDHITQGHILGHVRMEGKCMENHHHMEGDGCTKGNQERFVVYMY